MKTIFILLAITGMSISSCANAQAGIENIEQLRQNVARFLTDEYKSTQADKVEVKVGGLDTRLRLQQCEQPLSYALQDSSGTGGNVNVQVTCKSGTRWTILVPAQASVFRPIAVACRNLQRGQVVTEEDIQFESVEIAPYRQGFAITKEDIIGKEVRYAITKGDAFRTSALDAPLAIKRGDEVSVEAISGSIRVVTNGTAVSDGRLGQQIRVKNNQSERIVNARVLAAGKVQTIL